MRFPYLKSAIGRDDSDTDIGVLHADIPETFASGMRRTGVIQSVAAVDPRVVG